MLNLLYATLSGIDQTVFTSDCLFIYRGCFGHWELGIGNLLFGAHSRKSLHCSMCPNDQLPKQPFFDLASFLSFVLEVASHPGVLGKL